MKQCIVFCLPSPALPSACVYTSESLLWILAGQRSNKPNHSFEKNLNTVMTATNHRGMAPAGHENTSYD